MLQRLDVPIQSLTTETTTLHTDYFPSIVSALKKCKDSLENDRRLENFNWRLWRRGSTQSTTSTASMGETWSNCSYTSSPSSSSSFSLASRRPSTMIDASSTETAMIETTGLTSSCSDVSKYQQQPNFFVADVENNHADHQPIQSPLPTDDYMPQQQNQNNTIHEKEEDDDDESTLFGDDNEEIENTGQVTTDVFSLTYWPCYEFTKKQAPSVDHHQRSLLSSMLLHESCSSSVSSKMKSSSPASLTKNYGAPLAATSSLFTSWVDNNVLSTSMKQHVDWEKLQNGGPAAGLMGISKNILGTHPASSMTLVCDTLDTFTGCW